MKKLLAGLAIAGLAPVAAASMAGAAPTNAPNAFHGHAACGAAGSFNFVVNNANGQGQGTNNGTQATWAPAHLSNGGVFHPTEFINVTFTFTPPGGPPQTFVQNASRPNQTGDTTCHISGSQSGPFGTFSLDGTVVGNVTAG